MSLGRLQNALFSSEVIEKVEVNLRHLIDKILARYSTEFVIYRELLQNSDDAKATEVEIKFETEKSGNDNNINISDKCVRIVFKNNGFLFRPEDWDRLKNIAVGNPDEQKIGAFGVGFYSLFSVCTQTMKFFWDGDQLLIKRRVNEQYDKIWTRFSMDTLEKENKLPEIEAFGRFLATSLCFTGNLNKITVYFNEIQVIHLTKTVHELPSMPIKPEIRTNSPDNLFKLTSVDIFEVQMDVKRLITSPGTPINPYSLEEDSIFLKIASGNVDLNIPDSFCMEMERTTKKRPPKNTKIQMIFTDFDEQSSSSDQNNYASEIFRDLLPFPAQGRIFIGFPTFQTTGCSAHLAARLIPTVERESVDLVDKTLAKYNEGLLRLAGILSRMIYEDELTKISNLYKESFGSSLATFDDGPMKSKFEGLQKYAAHALTHFTFRESTPRKEISTLSESQFFDCTSTPLPILSTCGVLPITSIRIPTPETKPFIKIVPIVPTLLLDQCNEFFKKAEKAKDSSRSIYEVSIKDIFIELESRALNENEMTSLLKWWINYRYKDKATLEKFMKLVTIQVENTKVPLSKISHYLDPNVIPPDVEVPPSVLPYSISKDFKERDILAHFSDWSKLSLVTWARFISAKPLFEQDPTFSEKILGIIAHRFRRISERDQKNIRQYLAKKNCIPTKMGMKMPDQSYFPSADIFPDLAIISCQDRIDDEFFSYLGVRKRVEIHLLCDRLVRQGGWNHMELIKYLVRNEYEDEEIKKLSSKSIWPMESNNNRRFTARELYAPSSQLRDFELPIIVWDDNWNRNSREAKIMLKLGLCEYPPLGKILQLASPITELSIRQKALNYFLENLKTKYSKHYDAKKINIAFLPCTDLNVYAKPSECYTNTECRFMKFNVLHRDLVSRAEDLGVKKDPDRLQILEKLKNEPPDEEKAKSIFGYLSSFHFIYSDWGNLNRTYFIPIRDKKSAQLKYVKPSNCFFKCSDEDFADYFDYINFGEKANKFLRDCGVKDEPSPIDLAELLIESSHEVLKSQGIDKYTAILHKIDHKFSSVQKNNNVLNNLKKLGKCILASSKDIYISDNDIYDKIFEPLSCPPDQSLVRLYKKLGCQSLSSSVTSKSDIKGKILRPTEKSAELQNLIRERAPLFYHEINNNDINKYEQWVRELEVLEVDQIETTHTLAPKNITKVDNFITSCISKCERKLFIRVGESVNYYDVAKSISQLICKRPQLNMIAFVDSLLTKSLDDLRSRGLPVDQLLNLKKNNLYVVENEEISELNPFEEENFSDTDYYEVATETKHFSGKTQKIAPNYMPIMSTTSYEEAFPPLPASYNNNYDKHQRQSFSSKSQYEKSSWYNTSSTTVSQMSIEDLKKVLRDGISRTNSVDGQVKINFPENQISYCDFIPAHSLEFIGAENGVELYISKGLDPSTFSSSRIPLNNFIQMLKHLSKVFELPPKKVHVFYDSGNSTAFNRNNSLFFNFKYYLLRRDSEASETFVYWFMRFCHELAHNIRIPHDAQHE
ncbi:3665_t:CDS:10, partial [Entrophospora sp. SA101]